MSGLRSGDGTESSSGDDSFTALPRGRRVLLVHEPPDGGVAEHVMRLALGLRDEGFSAAVAGPRDSSIASVLSAAGIELHALSLVRSYRRPQADVAAATALWRLVRRRRIDIVHSHASKAGVLGRMAGGGSGVRTAYSPHCFGFVGDVSAPRKLAAATIERALGRITDAIICVSDAERNVALRARIAAPDRLHTILNGVPHCDSEIAPDVTLQRLRGDGPLVGAVSVLRRQKRLDVLLDAIPIVWRTVAAARFAIVGSGPLERELRSHAAALGLDRDERFAFLPFARPVERWLRALDLFVLPSAWEALPISVLEAMACGIPQVASDVGGTNEAVSEETGVLVGPGDPRALAGALIELLQDPARRARMSQASRERHRNIFNEARMVAEVADLYRSLLPVSAPRGATI